MLIGTAYKFEVAIGKQTREVSGSVEPFSRFSAEWVGDKFFRRQPGPIQISATEADAADIEFSGHADRQGIQMRVQQINSAVLYRPANGGLAITRVALSYGRPDRGFRRAVGIKEGTARMPASDEFAGARLSGGNDGPQGRKRLGRQSGERRRGDDENGNPLVTQQLGQRRPRQQGLLAAHAQASARQQRHGNLKHGGVKAERRKL